MGLTDYNPADGLRRGPWKRPEPIQLPKFASLTVNDTTETEKRAVLRESFFMGAAASVETVGVDADGTILLYVCKYDAVTNAEVVLTDALNAEAMVTKETAFFVVLSTLTEAQLTLHVGDSVYAKAVNNSAAINTQPTNLAVTLDVFRRS